MSYADQEAEGPRQQAKIKELERKLEEAKNDLDWLIEAVMDSRLAIIRAGELKQKLIKEQK